MSITKGDRVDLLSHYEDAPTNGEVLWVGPRHALVDWGGTSPDAHLLDDLVLTGQKRKGKKK
jgi:hypothetical protein